MGSPPRLASEPHAALWMIGGEPLGGENAFTKLDAEVRRSTGIEVLINIVVNDSSMGPCPHLVPLIKIDFPLVFFTYNYAPKVDLRRSSCIRLFRCAKYHQ